MRCGRKDAEPHKRMCAECAAKVAAYSLKQYHAMDAAAKKRRQEQKKRLVASRIMYARLVQGVRAEGGQGKDTLSGLYSKGQPTGKEAS